MNKNGSDFTLTKMALECQLMHVKTGWLEGLIDACESRVAGRAN